VLSTNHDFNESHQVALPFLEAEDRVDVRSLVLVFPQGPGGLLRTAERLMHFVAGAERCLLCRGLLSPRGPRRLDRVVRAERPFPQGQEACFFKGRMGREASARPRDDSKRDDNFVEDYTHILLFILSGLSSFRLFLIF